jgi:hypothetical protein
MAPIRKRELIDTVPNPLGLWKCKRCGEALPQLKVYQSPGGQSSEAVGKCPNKACALYGEEQCV